MSGLLWMAAAAAGLGVALLAGFALLDRGPTGGPYGFDALLDALLIFGLLEIAAAILAIAGLVQGLFAGG